MQALPPAPPAVVTQVLAARTYDRANALDSARVAYEAAATQLPAVADWLWLRAAGVTADPQARARDYQAVHQFVARLRIPWTEAQARERTGDFAGAARLYDSLGARADALRNSATLVSASGDSTARANLRTELVVLIATHAGTADARAATEIVDRLFTPLTLPEERAIARSAALAGPLPRAAAAFERLQAGGPPSSTTALSPQERFTYGTVLQRLRRDADAARVFAALSAKPPRHATVPPVPTPIVRAAQYEQARVLVAAGDRKGARKILRPLVRGAPRDSIAADALMLLADLAADDGDDRAARSAYKTVAQRFPANPLAPLARFRAALIAFVSGSFRTAAEEWDALAATRPQSDESVAARYWGGRAWSRMKRQATAIERWRAILHDDPLSYYATLSARRLGAPTSLVGLTTDTTTGATPARLDSALTRAALLEQLGMLVEERFEVEHATRYVGNDPAAIEAAGAAFVRAGEPSRAIAFGWHVVGRSGAAGDSARRDIRVYRLLYPLAYTDQLVADARARGLDPALVAAVVRQESDFNPRAVSSAGARGLMQVLPAVARAFPGARHNTPGGGVGGGDRWDPSTLDDPAVNLSIGVGHLATFIAQERGDTLRGLAAYNAGPSRVTVWAARRGVSDPEVFVERIPFAETRDYVRAIVRGREVYATIYRSILANR